MPIKSSEVTPEKVYKRRRILITAGVGVLGVPLTDKAYGVFQQKQDGQTPFPKVATLPNEKSQPLVPTPYETITSYNNYYEFGFGKDDPSKVAKKFTTSPWSVEIGGEGTDKPGTYAIADIKGESAIENHISISLRRSVVDSDPVEWY